MNNSSISPPLAIPDVDRSSRRWFARLVDWAVAARSHRVICLLIGLWVINAFDVTLTILAHHQGMLEESNPIARRLLLHSPYVITLYKVGLVTFASVVLLKQRTRLVAEIAAGGMLLIYTIVAIQWRLCYELYALTYAGDIRQSDIDAIDLTILSSFLAPY